MTCAESVNTKKKKHAIMIFEYIAGRSKTKLQNMGGLDRTRDLIVGSQW